MLVDPPVIDRPTMRRWRSRHNRRWCSNMQASEQWRRRALENRRPQTVHVRSVSITRRRPRRRILRNCSGTTTNVLPAGNPARHSTTNRAPLDELHALQHGAKLPSKLVPPRTSGTTWSTVSHGPAQYAHELPRAFHRFSNLDRWCWVIPAASRSRRARCTRRSSSGRIRIEVPKHAKEQNLTPAVRPMNAPPHCSHVAG